MINIYLKKSNGITLISLVITIIVLVILSGVVITNAISGNIERAKQVAVQNDLKTFEEKVQIYKTNRQIKDGDEFEGESLYADENELKYNTKSEDERGNIYTIIPEAEEKYKGKIYIEKGVMIFDSTDDKENKWAKEVGIQTTGILIDKDGKLLCVTDVSCLIDNDGVLTIPSRVKTISEGAFSGIDINIKKVIIPSTCKEIEKNAFNGQNQIEEIIMEDNGVEKIGIGAFKWCTNLKHVKVANSVTEIGGDIFFKCKSLTTVELSNKIETIPGLAFYDCTSLETLTIPDNVKTIEGFAFQLCSKLNNLKIGSGVTSIGSGAFDGCKNLIATVAENNPKYKMIGNALCTANGDRLLQIFKGGDLTEYSIPEGIKYIDSVFSTCTNIEKIIIPSSLEELNGMILTPLKKLNNIVVNSENQNFYSDGKALYNKDKTIIIRYYSQDESYTIKDTVTIIEAYCFDQNTNIKNLVLPDNLVEIKVSSFKNTLIKNINLGPKVEKLHGMSLYGISVDTVVTIDSENPYFVIENDMLFNIDKTILIRALKRKETIEIPNGVTEIKDYAFHYNQILKNVTIPNSVVKIGNSFNYCTLIETIEIPSSVKEIHQKCFSETKIKEIIIHKEEGSIKYAPWGQSSGIKVVKWLGN